MDTAKTVDIALQSICPSLTAALQALTGLKTTNFISCLSGKSEAHRWFQEYGLTKKPQHMNWVGFSHCVEHEWPVWLPHGSDVFYATAEIFVLRALAARTSNLQVGLSTAVRVIKRP
jgi:hypothetical protein